jgi:hypothetical protein
MKDEPEQTDPEIDTLLKKMEARVESEMDAEHDERMDIDPVY